MNARHLTSSHVPHAAAPSRLASYGALAGLLLLALRSWRLTHRRRRAERPAQPPPEPLQVWEDEGGQNQMVEPQVAAPPTAGPPR